MVVTEAPPVRSGIAAVVGRLTTGLRDLGHEVEAVTTAEVGRRQLGEIRLTGLVKWWPQLRRQLGDVDVVHLHGPAPTFSDAFLALWSTVPRSERPGLVYTHHSEIELLGAGPLNAIYNGIHRRLSRAASHIVVSTESYRERLTARGRLANGYVEVIPFGIDEGHPSRRDRRGRLVVAFVGQLRPYKGVDVLIRAAAQLPDIAVHIAGTGHQGAALRQLAARLGASNVTFHGDVTDEAREQLLAAADVVALPSLTRAEAFGIVLLEGMRAGAVPVASDLPGVRDVAGGPGLLVRPGSVRALVQALCHLRDDPADRALRSAAAVEAAAAYRWEATVRDYHRVLADSALMRHVDAPVPLAVDGALRLMRDAALSERASLLLLEDESRLRLASVSGRPLREVAPGAAVDLDSFAGRALLAGEPYVVTTDSLGRKRQPEAHAGLCIPFSVDGGSTRGVVSFTRLRRLDFLAHEVGWMSRRVEAVAARVDHLGLQHSPAVWSVERIPGAVGPRGVVRVGVAGADAGEYGDSEAS
jgi:rhamnosyl/mannosyltransferase